MSQYVESLERQMKKILFPRENEEVEEAYQNLLLYQINRRKLWTLYESQKNNPNFLRFFEKIFERGICSDDNSLSFANKIFPVVDTESCDEEDLFCYTDYDYEYCPFILTPAKNVNSNFLSLLNSLRGDTEIFNIYMGTIKARTYCDCEHQSFKHGGTVKHFVENISDYQNLSEIDALLDKDVFYSIYLELENGLYLLLKRLGLTLPQEILLDEIFVKPRDEPKRMLHFPSEKSFMSHFHVRLSRNMEYMFSKENRNAESITVTVDSQLVILRNFIDLLCGDFAVDKGKYLLSLGESSSSGSFANCYNEWIEQITDPNDPFTLSDYLSERGKPRQPMLEPQELFILYRRERNLIHSFLTKKIIYPTFITKCAKAVMEFFPEEIRHDLPIDAQDQFIFEKFKQTASLE